MKTPSSNNNSVTSSKPNAKSNFMITPKTSRSLKPAHILVGSILALLAPSVSAVSISGVNGSFEETVGAINTFAGSPTYGTTYFSGLTAWDYSYDGYYNGSLLDLSDFGMANNPDQPTDGIGNTKNWTGSGRDHRVAGVWNSSDALGTNGVVAYIIDGNNNTLSQTLAGNVGALRAVGTTYTMSFDLRMATGGLDFDGDSALDAYFEVGGVKVQAGSWRSLYDTTRLIPFLAEMPGGDPTSGYPAAARDNPGVVRAGTIGSQNMRTFTASADLSSFADTAAVRLVVIKTKPNDVATGPLDGRAYIDNIRVDALGTAGWTGSGANTSWSTTGNWTANGVAGLTGLGNSDLFAKADLARGATGATIALNGAAPKINNLTINGGTGAVGAYTISQGTGGSITLGGTAPVINVLAGTSNTISAPVGLAASASVDTSTGASLGMSGVISGTGFGLTKRGAGTLTLSGANNYTGATTVNDGTLLLDMTGSGALSASSALALGGGTFSVLGKTGANVTAQTLASLSLTAGASSIVITPNGGTSTTLTITSAAVTSAAGRSLHFDTSVGTPGTALVAWNPTLTSGLIGGGFTMRDNAGTGFATITGGNVTRLTPGTVLAAGNPNSATTNFLTNTAGTITNTVVAAALNSLTVDTAAGSNIWDLGGNTATVSTGGLAMAGANNFTIQSGTLRSNTAGNSDLIVNQWGSGAMAISSVIANGNGNSSLTKSGTGTLTLSGANTYTGGTFVNAGTVTLSGAGTLGNAAALTLSGGGLNLGTLSATVGNVSITAAAATGDTIQNGSLTGANNIDYAASNPRGNAIISANLLVSGGAGFAKSGGGTTTLSGVNTYTGSTTVSGGILALSGSGTLGNGAALTLSGGSLDLGTTSQTVGAVSVTTAVVGGDTIKNGSLTGALNTNYAVSNTTGTAIISANLLASGTAGFDKSGAGTTTLSGANAFTGVTTISVGTLSINSIRNAGSVTANALGTPAAGVDSIIGLAATGTLQYTGTTAGSSDRVINLSTAGGGTFTLDASGSTAFALSGGITTSGTSGTSTLLLTGTGNGSQGGTIVDGTGNVTAVTKTGNSIWTLSGANTYTGTTTLTTARLQVGVASVGTPALITSSAIGKGTLSFDGGFISSDSTTARTILNPVTLTGNATNNFGIGDAPVSLGGTGNIGKLTFEGTMNLGTVVRSVGVHSAAEFKGVVSGAGGGLTKNGFATLTLSGAHTYTGAVTVREGTLAIGANAPSGADGALGNATSDVNLGVAGAASRASDGYRNASILISGGAFTVGRIIRLATNDGSDGGTRVLTIGGDTAHNSVFSGNIFLGTTNQAGKPVTLTAASGGQVTFSGVIQGPGGTSTAGEILLGTVTKTGLGTVVLSGVNTYTGTTTVNAGTFTLQNPSAGLTQTLTGALTLAGPDVTLHSDYNSGSGNLSTTFGSFVARTAGNTENIVRTGGDNTTNKIVLTSTANAPLAASGSNNLGIFFGGSEYARYSAANTTFQAVDYGTDSNAQPVVAGGATLGFNNAAFDAKITAAITNQTTASVNTVNVAGNNNLTLDPLQTLSINGILKSGNVAGGATISGGTGIQTTGSGGEMVIRTDGTDDALTISTPILANGTNALTKSGAGVLTLSAANTHTGLTYVNGGTLTVANTLALQFSTLNPAVNNAVVFDAAVAGAVTVGGLSGSGGFALQDNAGSPAAVALTAGGNNFNTTYSGALGGSGSLVKTGTGTLTLNGANTYAGTTTVSVGTLRFDSAASIGGSGRSVTVANSATVVAGYPINNAFLNRLVENSNTSTVGLGFVNSAFLFVNTNPLDFGSATGATLDNASLAAVQAMTYAGTLTPHSSGYKLGGGTATLTMDTVLADSGGSRSLTKRGTADTVILTKDNTYTGGTTISGGTLQVGGGGSVGSLGAGTVTNTATLDFRRADVFTVSNNITGAGGILNKTLGVGTLILTGTNNYTGATNVSAGILRFNSLASIAATTRNITVNANSTVALGYASGTIQTDLLAKIVSGSAGAVALTADTNENLDFSSGGPNNFTGLFLGAVGNATFGGTLTPNGTTYRLGGGGGTLTVSGLNTITGATNNLTVGGIIYSTVVLSNSNDFAGTTTVNAAATLRIAHGDGLGTSPTGLAATGTTVTSGGILELQGGITVGNEALTINGVGIGSWNYGSLRNVSGNNQWSGPVTLGAASRITSDSGTLTFDVASGNAITGSNLAPTFAGNGNITVADPINIGTAALTMEGFGVLELTGANVYTGNTNIRAGVIRAVDGTGLPTPSVLQFNGGGPTGGTIATAGSLSGILETSVNFARTIGTAAGNVTWTGDGGFAARTSDVNVTLNGSAASVIDWSAATGFNGKVLFFGSSTADKVVTLKNPVNLAAGTRTIAVLDNAGTTADYAVLDNIVSGTGASNLIKAGAGTLVLSGDNSYAGTTTVSAGTLVAAHANALGLVGSNTTVSSGATLDVRVVLAAEPISVTGTGFGGLGALITADTFTGTVASTVTLTGATSIGGAGSGILNINGIVAAGGNTLTTLGTGETTFGTTSTLTSVASLAVTDGTTNVNSPLGTAGNAVVTVSDTVGGVATKLRFGSVSQTLTSLTIGAGATVIFTSGAASGSLTGDDGGGKAAGFGSPASSFAGGATVPEPGTLGLLLVGALGMLNRRRRA